MTVLFDAAVPSQPTPLPAAFRLGHFELQGAEPGAAHNADSMLYRAWDHALVRPVAVTEYLPAVLARRAANGSVGPQSAGDATAFSEGLERFIHLARVLAKVEHPNLLRVLHLKIHHGTAYQVSPWYRGQRLQTLRTLMAAPPDELTLRALLDEVLGALQALQRVGRVHGAIHPDNILVLANDRALLLAPSSEVRSFDESRLNGYVPQSPHHVPGSTAGTPWGDCQALAQVARFCITGLWPVDPVTAPAEPLQASIDRLFFDKPSVRYAPDLLRALDRAADADPSRRPQSAAEFRAWLEQPPPDDTRRAPAWATTAAAAALAAATVQRQYPPATDHQAFAATPSEPPGPLDSAPADDAATARVIRQLVNSIPALPRRRPDLDPPPEQGEPTAASRLASNEAAFMPPWRANGEERYRTSPVPKAPRRVGLLAGLTLALLAGTAIWFAREPVQRSIEARTNSISVTSETLANTAPETAAPSMTEAVDPSLTSGPPTSAGNPQAVTAEPELLPETVTERVSANNGPIQTDQNMQASVPASTSASLTLPEAPVEAPAGETPIRQSADDTLRAVPGLATSSAEKPWAAARLAEDTPAAVPSAAVSPRQQCGARSQFALYRCMQQQCATARWQKHPQCVQLRQTDQVN